VDGIKVKFASPILHEGRLYVCDEVGRLFCLDAAKGTRLWKRPFAYGRNTKGSPVWADGKIYVTDVDGSFNVLKPGKDRCERLAEVRFPNTGIAPVELHGSPAVVNGRIYFTTTEQLVCIGKEGHKAKPDAIPAGPKEPPLPKGAKATHLQIVPADVTLSPGEKVELTAITYDDHGRKIGAVKADWSPAGVAPPVFPPGVPAPKPAGKPTAPPPINGSLGATSGEKTTFTAGSKPNGQFGRIVAKADGLTGYCRVRALPVLPYTQDFANVPEGRTPAAWVNAPGKFSVVKLPDGKKVLFKRNDTANPIINRANAYITGPHTKDFTIECDVHSTKERGFLGDMGVGGCGYSLWLLGKNQQLRLVTWDLMPRLEKKVRFEWKEDTWYRLKMMATVEDGKGVIKGKVWPRDQKEPEKWTVELSDPIPNVEGAALLYGYSNGAFDVNTPGPKIYYDNVKIVPNKKK
jgi:hypothetical protein